MAEIRFRPIDSWPSIENPSPRRSQFKAKDGTTWTELKREIAYLDGENVVLQAYLRENQIRIDGWPRSESTPSKPGVIIAFDSKFGPLKYATDTFDRFMDNVRGIALGLEEAVETAEAITGRRVLASFAVSEPAVRPQTLAQAIDGLCDLLAVVYGAAVTFGIDLAPFWDEVHRTNMAKAGGPKREDGKQLKPDGWQPPDLDGLLERLYGIRRPGVRR